jgi:hypothetical protein
VHANPERITPLRESLPQANEARGVDPCRREKARRNKHGRVEKSVADDQAWKHERSEARLGADQVAMLGFGLAWGRQLAAKRRTSVSDAQCHVAGELATREHRV